MSGHQVQVSLLPDSYDSGHQVPKRNKNQLLSNENNTKKYNNI